MALVVTSTALVFKSLLSLSNLRTTNLDLLVSLLPASGTQRKPGLLTYSNHISTLDDPLWCCSLPLSTISNYSAFRWTLGAKDICFTNPLFAAYFRAGKVLETDRKAGIYQASVDDAIRALNQGQWVHIFPEGYVNQPKAPKGSRHDDLLRFRWGISRMILESSKDTHILPIHLSGFDQIMPEGRSFPWKFMPKAGANLSVACPRQPLDRRRLIDPLMRHSESWNRGNLLKAPYEDEALALKTARMDIARVLREELLSFRRELQREQKI